MLHAQIKSEIPNAMRAKDQLRLDTLRGMVTAFMNELVATKRKPDEELKDEETLAVIRREVKKRKEAADAFRSGDREELADKEDKERALLEAYLPAMMSREDIKKIVQAKITETGMDKSKAGQLVGALMKDLKGKADGSDVKSVVDEILS
jgi:uncharacterized protein